jgi:hypothetical protein
MPRSRREYPRLTETQLATLKARLIITEDGHWLYPRQKRRDRQYVQIAGRHYVVRVLLYVNRYGTTEGHNLNRTCGHGECVNPEHQMLRLPIAVKSYRTFRPPGSPPGESHPRAKLTNEIVREIRRRHARGEEQEKLGAEYGVHGSHVSRIVHGKTWRTRESGWAAT